jgi:hypothetical protein
MRDGCSAKCVINGGRNNNSIGQNGVCILPLAIIQGAYESGFPSDWPKAMAGAHTMPCIKAEKVENRS